MGKDSQGAAKFLLAALPALGALLTALAITGDLVGRMARNHPWATFAAFGCAALAVFLGAVAAFGLRESSDAERRVLYVGLLVLGIGGLGAAAQVGWLTAPWVVASYVVVVVVLVLMWAIAGSYYYALRDGLEGTPKVPRLDDEALAARLRSSRRPEILAVIGGTGLVILIALMTVRPGA